MNRLPGLKWLCIARKPKKTECAGALEFQDVISLGKESCLALWCCTVNDEVHRCDSLGRPHEVSPGRYGCEAGGALRVICSRERPAPYGDIVRIGQIVICQELLQRNRQPYISYILPLQRTAAFINGQGDAASQASGLGDANDLVGLVEAVVCMRPRNGASRIVIDAIRGQADLSQQSQGLSLLGVSTVRHLDFSADIAGSK